MTLPRVGDLVDTPDGIGRVRAWERQSARVVANRRLPPSTWAIVELLDRGGTRRSVPVGDLTPVDVVDVTIGKEGGPARPTIGSDGTGR